MQRHHWIAVGLVLATLVAFEPVRECGFVNFDDRTYVTENEHVRRGLSAESLAWAFNVGHASNWHPLTWVSHMLDVSLWGLDPRAHHLVGLLLHAAGVVLLFDLLRRMTNETGKSAFVAAVFAVHPLHVESVAWVSERKDVLSALLGILSLRAWFEWTRKGGKLRYAAALSLYGLGLMAKPMLVTFPFLLVLLDHWPLRRGAGKFLAEKVPFFALAAVSCALTVVAQGRGGAISGVLELPVALRLANAACAYVAYLGKALWPADLAFFYPYPLHLSVVSVASCTAFLLGTTAIVLLQARARPWLAVGWLWWVGMLVPVIGVVQVGQQSMADRYMHLSILGLAITFAWGAGELISKTGRGKIASAGIAVVLVGAWVVLTRAQTAIWRDDFTLFGHAVAVTERNHVAHYRLGYALTEAGRLDEARKEFEAAARANPRFAMACNDIGRILEKQGKLEQAIEYYRQAIEIDGELAAARANLASALDASGRSEEAFALFEEGVRVLPENPDLRFAYALSLLRHGRFAEAADQLSRVVSARPDFGEAYFYLGEALANVGRMSEAIESVRHGLRLRPDRADARAALERMIEDEAASASRPR